MRLYRTYHRLAALQRIAISLQEFTTKVYSGILQDPDFLKEIDQATSRVEAKREFFFFASVHSEKYWFGLLQENPELLFQTLKNGDAQYEFIWTFYHVAGRSLPKLSQEELLQLAQKFLTSKELQRKAFQMYGVERRIDRFKEQSLKLILKKAGFDQLFEQWYSSVGGSLSRPLDSQTFWDYIDRANGDPEKLYEVIPPEHYSQFANHFFDLSDEIQLKIYDGTERVRTENERAALGLVAAGQRVYNKAMRAFRTSPKMAAEEIISKFDGEEFEQTITDLLDLVKWR